MAETEPQWKVDHFYSKNGFIFLIALIVGEELCFVRWPVGSPAGYLGWPSRIRITDWNEQMEGATECEWDGGPV